METLKQCLMRRLRRGAPGVLEGGHMQPVPTCDAPLQEKPAVRGQTVSGKPDGGYGWVVVLASFLTHVTIYGVCWSVGMFNMMFLESFHQSKSATAWVGSLLNAVVFVSGVPSSALVTRYGCRSVVIAGGVLASTGLALSALSHRLWVVYVTFSGLGGVGLGLAYVPAIVCVSEHFERRRTIALGLAVSGVGFGCFVFPPVIRALTELLSWRLVLVVIAVLVVSSLTLAGALMAPPPSSCRPTAPAADGGYLRELRECVIVMRTPPMLTLSLNHFLFCFGQAIVYVHLGAFAESAGLLSRAGTATLFSIIGVSNLVGRIVHGVICHFPQMASILVFTASTFVTGVSTILFAVCADVTSLSVCASVFGFASCCLGALTPDIVIGLVGDSRLAVTYSYLMLFEAAGFMLGAPFAGLLYDHTATYLPSLYSAGGLLLLSAVVMAVPWRYRGVQLVVDAERGEVLVPADPPTPVKEPAHPEDFLYPPSAAATDRAGEEQAGHWDAPAEVDLGEADDTFPVWRAPDSDPSRPLLSDARTECAAVSRTGGAAGEGDCPLPESGAGEESRVIPSNENSRMIPSEDSRIGGSSGSDGGCLKSETGEAEAGEGEAEAGEGSRLLPEDGADGSDRLKPAVADDIHSPLGYAVPENHLPQPAEAPPPHQYHACAPGPDRPHPGSTGLDVGWVAIAV